MDAFTIQIAGLTARVQPMFVSTREYCRRYLSDLEPECFMEITMDGLQYTQALLEKEAVEDGLRVRKFPEPFLERFTIQRMFACELLEKDTLLVHGSSVGVDGEAFLFAAPSRTGKSTHTRFWRETFGDRSVMVNDDKTFLQITSGGVFAYGSPWSGKHGLDTNIRLPLKGICFLRRGTANRIKAVEPEACLEELQHHTFVPEDPEGMAKAQSLVEKLSRQVSLWQMECTKDPAAALVSYHAMSKG